MERHGFIHSMMDVKVLILYVMTRVLYPLNGQTIYELCLQDDCLSYFDVLEAIPQLVETGHLQQTPDGLYEITEKGRETSGLVEDSLAYPVAQRAMQAVERFNREAKRKSLVRTEILERDNGDYSVILGLDDEKGCLMTLELMAPNRQQAKRLAATFHDHAEQIFHTVMTSVLELTEGEAC